MRYHRVITSLISMLVLLVIYPLTHAGGGRAVPADEAEIIRVNDAETSFEVVDY